MNAEHFEHFEVIALCFISLRLLTQRSFILILMIAGVH